MYAAIRRYRVPLDAVDEITRQVQEGFIPLISQVPGFVEYYWLNARNGILVSISVFQDQAAAEESTRMAADYIRQNLAALMRNPPEVTEGEIVFHHGG